MRLLRTLLPLALGLAGLLFPAGPGRGMPVSDGAPNVLILVAAMTDGQDQIGITYSGVVPHAQARRDVAALRAVTGWPLKRVHITDAPSALLWDKTKMTGVECVAGRVVRPATHGLAVQPFVQAFHGYAHVQLTFFVRDGFPFQGLHDYADNKVRIRLEQRGDAFTYEIFIHDPRLERLTLPYLQPPTTDAQAGAARPRATPWLLALGALVAVGMGGAAYALLSRAA